MNSVARHQREIERNHRYWESKPLLREIYTEFYQQILAKIDPTVSGQVVEIGSGIGNLKAHLAEAVTTDLFPNPWLDHVCSAYDMPFADKSVSHLVLFDVFHHLRAPIAFFNESRRVLVEGGRIILFEPYISLLSFLVYGLFHDEPVGWRKPIEMSPATPELDYYAAQGNATRLFFRGENAECLSQWDVVDAKAFSCFHYFLSGGYSKPGLYPVRFRQPIKRMDEWLSHWPRIFGGRCLIVLRKI